LSFVCVISHCLNQAGSTTLTDSAVENLHVSLWRLGLNFCGTWLENSSACA